MTRPILGWGLGICALAGLGVVVFGFGAPQAPALLFGIGGFMVALAAVLAVSGLGRNRPDAVQSLPDVSPPTTLVALGVVTTAIGAVAGEWATWIGAGMALVGLAGLAREARAQRGALRLARRQGDAGRPVGCNVSRHDRTCSPRGASGRSGGGPAAGEGDR